MTFSFRKYVFALIGLAVIGLIGLASGPPQAAGSAPAAAQAGMLVATVAQTGTITLTTLPSAPGTFNVPVPVASGVPPVPTGGTGTVASPVTGGVQPGTAVGTPTPAGGSGGGSTPWPLIIGGLLLLGIAAGAVYAFTRRGTTPAARPAVPPPAPLAHDTTGSLNTAPLPAVVPVVASPPGSAPTVPMPTAGGRNTALPTMVKCPNCNTMNPIDRRYCDECGQDLRAAVATALADPLPEVEATTPYLETMSRVDEQLEFVLARDQITIGRALDNDIVIDDQFIGWQTVSPQHAELRRTANGFLVRDLQSENGTFVNSARTGENLLQDGMTLAFGKVEFIYRVPTE